MFKHQCWLCNVNDWIILCNSQTESLNGKWAPFMVYNNSLLKRGKTSLRSTEI